MGSPEQEHQIEVEYVKIGDFQPIFRYMLETMHDWVIVVVVVVAVVKRMFINVT